jgi:hypothetical protein
VQPAPAKPAGKGFADGKYSVRLSLLHILSGIALLVSEDK